MAMEKFMWPGGRTEAKARRDEGSRPMAPPELLELLPLAVYGCDRDGRILWFNRRATELWNRIPAAGERDEDLIAIAGRTRAIGEWPTNRVLATGEAAQDVTAVLQRPDGSRLTVKFNIGPIFTDGGGAVAGAIVCISEVGETAPDVAANSDRPAVLANDDVLRQLLDALPAAVYTTDAAGLVTYCNEAAVALAGRRPQLGTDSWCVTWRLFDSDGTPMPHERCPMAQALREGRPVRNVEVMVERPDGTRVPVLPYPTPLRDASGAIVGAINMLVDVSERKQAETRHAILVDELNHRIKNNMQMLHALLRNAHGETASGDARLVLADAIQRIAAMAAAQRVLYQSRDPLRFDAGGFIQAVAMTARQAFGGVVSITCQTAPVQLPNDLAMPLALMLSELLINAVKHGGGKVTVGLQQDMQEYELYVQDGGPGFADGAIRAGRRSSGLGLVSGLARQLGARFSILSGPGARCSVRFAG